VGTSPEYPLSPKIKVFYSLEIIKKNKAEPDNTGQKKKMI
jgi:hypothetical protein